MEKKKHGKTWIRIVEGRTKSGVGEKFRTLRGEKTGTLPREGGRRERRTKGEKWGINDEHKFSILREFGKELVGLHLD